MLKPLARDNKVHAYLRWTVDGRSVSRSLGPVTNSTRAANLTDGWNLARSEGFVHDQALPPESWASSAEVRASMRGNRSRDTTPERQLRALLHARGLRYRVSVRPVPTLRRTADIVFPKARVAVFVDGCYWHGCPEHHRPATKNSEFWRTKISENRQRDAETNQALATHGWTVVRCWEHEDPVSAADRVASVLSEAL
ncbi:very short patch repair endonuclease [Lentzea nigeriaca]|uniref:very short patch repair endonuclease n=1 Tax=Lentzea nigeriaca TaxID=1128665 RepID=UPI0027DCAE49|nr:very short patch repair endonuclease [Lentzea nigeriaca]MBM7860569.1 DNA mismatch endonuclease (patch repair protein) [Lentzea nigeriaca]